MIDIIKFPRTTNNDLNWTAYMQYRRIIKNMTNSEEKSFDEYLRRKYNIRRDSQ